MNSFNDVARIAPLRIWDGIRARSVQGERITMAVVELDPGAVVPDHRHENEQLGIVLRGSVTFRVGDETQELGPGGTWCIASDTSHEVVAGSDGAVVIDIFAPVRGDWSALEPEAPTPPRWPG